MYVLSSHLIAVVDAKKSDMNISVFGYCNKDMNYKTILATKSLPVKRENLNFHTGSPVLALLGLAKFTTIFERSFSFNEIQKLMKNETAILTGCLLVKLSSVLFTGCGSINLVDPAVEDGSYGETKPAYEMNAQEWVIRKCYMSHITTMLALYGCIPNADSCRTIGHKSLLYALQPIKAGTPIMTYNKSLSIYLEVPKEVRQHQLRLFYGFSCECRACKENWPEKMLEMPPLFAFTPGTNFAALTRFMKESESIRKECDDNMYAHKPGFPDLKLMTRANNCAREVWKHMPVPSLFMKSCADMMICVTTCFHDPDKNIFTISE
ncbi:hypothetical protein QAD02_011336 [Eretmocerus hayati]|uniref:Uncharacterized protein n=1 Tax=Eretmocerus hayati TaxID=131215 RepID=A0ACC2NW72_9HYME|nr:hypothetical protein QAD02_011336 [Eretmocerus hayati]